MLLIFPIVVAILAFNVWILVRSLRSGVYSLRSGQDTPGHTATVVTISVDRRDRPLAFRVLVAFNAVLIAYLTYIVYLVAGITYESFLAGEW